jgi:hypothetical protein
MGYRVVVDWWQVVDKGYFCLKCSKKEPIFNEKQP